MKYGYSNLLSETVDATALTYDDCRAFQIVCPACREPVFKAFRELPRETNYLSHYRNASEYPVDCELRVNGMDPEQIQRDNAEARGQKLALFLRVFRDAVMRTDYKAHGEKIIRTIARSRALGTVRALQVKQCRALAEAHFTESARYYVNGDVGAGHAMFSTGFALDTQVRIAFDVWRTLCTEPAHENINFLWNHGYSMVLWRLQLARDQGILDAPSRQLRSWAEQILRENRQRGLEILAEMSNTPAPQPFALEGSSYLTKLASEVAHEMIGCLVRLPYLQLLQENQK